jgi:hypothetical protein
MWREKYTGLSRAKYLGARKQRIKAINATPRRQSARVGRESVASRQRSLKKRAGMNTRGRAKWILTPHVAAIHVTLIRAGRCAFSLQTREYCGKHAHADAKRAHDLFPQNRTQAIDANLNAG